MNKHIRINKTIKQFFKFKIEKFQRFLMFEQL